MTQRAWSIDEVVMTRRAWSIEEVVLWFLRYTDCHLRSSGHGSPQSRCRYDHHSWNCSHELQSLSMHPFELTFSAIIKILIVHKILRPIMINIFYFHVFWKSSFPKNKLSILKQAQSKLPITVRASPGAYFHHHNVRDHFVYAPSQWDETLQCNVVSLAGRIHKMIPVTLRPYWCKHSHSR